MNRERVAFEKWKTLVSSLPFLKKRESQSEASVVATETDKETQKMIFPRLTKFRKKSLPIVITIMTGLISVITYFITNLDKVQLGLTWFFKPDYFSCEGITIQIPRDWQQLGCKPVALYFDATIIPKSFVSNESNSPKILLSVEDLYESNITLQKFYTKEKEQAKLFIDGKKNTNFREEKFQFKTHPAYELVYGADKIKRRDIGFLYRGKQYIIRYESSPQDFDKYEKKAKEIVNSLEFNPEKEAK